MLSKLDGAQLAVDSGNALFRDASSNEEAQKRAKLILSVMGELGVKVMVAGQRDLSAGTEFLATNAKQAGVQVLSANLRRQGQLVFPASTVVKVGGKRVGFVGVTAPLPLQDGVEAGPTVEAVKQALATLGPVDVTIVLAATSYPDAMQLDAELKGKIDFIIQSSDSRGAVPAQRLEAAYLFGGGSRGQQLGQVTINANGKGAFTDLAEVKRVEDQLTYLDQQLAQLDERSKKVTDPAAKADFAKTTADMRKRRAEQKANVAAMKKRIGDRTFEMKWIVLGKEIADDEALKKRVLQIEPTYEGRH